MLAEEDRLNLEKELLMEDLKVVVWDYERDKFIGPNEIKFNFIKNCWSVLKEDIFNFITKFYWKAQLPKGILASFLALVPKLDNPQALGDYRPIFLVSSLYKILAKVLTVRLNRVLNNVISPCQSTFISRKHILDVVLVVNELIDLDRRKKRECFLFKVDFKKL